MENGQESADVKKGWNEQQHPDKKAGKRQAKYGIRAPKGNRRVPSLYA